MTLSGTKSKSSIQRLLPFIFSIMVIIVFSLLTILAAMLVTGSVHVINKRFLHFDKILFVTVPIAAAIFISALIFYVKNSKKIYLSIEDMILMDSFNRKKKFFTRRRPDKPE